METRLVLHTAPLQLTHVHTLYRIALILLDYSTLCNTQMRFNVGFEKQLLGSVRPQNVSSKVIMRQ